MKKFVAAIAAIVIVGAGLSAAPSVAFADAPAPAAGPIAAPAAPIAASIAPPVDVTPPHPHQVPTSAPAVAAAPDVAAPDSANPDAAASAAATSVISGTVTFDGVPFGGAIVTAFLFDKDGNQTFQSASVVSASDGSFLIPALAAGDYWVQYEEHSNPEMYTYQWWGSDVLNQYGRSAAVASGATGDFSWNLTEMGGVKGTVSCSTCDTAPDRATVEILVGAYDPSTDLYHFVDGGRPAADGSFAFISLFPYGDYRIFAEYTGTGPFNKYSNSAQFAIDANAFAGTSVIVSRHIDPIPGYGDIYGVADNSVVNALYFDFLNRLPSQPEAKGWVRLLYNGTDPGAVSAGFVNSDEYRLIRIDAAYQSILGRPSDPSGRADWLANMKAGRITTDDIETSFYASAEYLAKHGGTNTSFAKALYTDLLHRSGSASDWAFWGDLARRNGRAWVIAQFWNEPETIGERVTLMYEKYLGRTPDAAGLQSWVNVALAIGDSGLRSGLTGSVEYFLRSQDRFREE
jgi:hypothetical protein